MYFVVYLYKVWLNRKETMEYNIEDAKKELREVNNCLSLYMKKKRALQTFIQDENDRIKMIASPKSKAWELKHDRTFIEEHGRERTQQEVARLMGYSLKQVQRFLNEKEV